MRILITGGTGFIGRNLKKLFSEKGYDVLTPTHFELNLLNKEDVVAYFKKETIDIVIHCASKGGNRELFLSTFENTYIPNITMFENLQVSIGDKDIPLIVFGSGAEFDRRYDIFLLEEKDLWKCWPIDPYGLSKNIIAKRGNKNVWNLRLFGCFNYDEESYRFIKNSINRLKSGKNIEIQQNKLMDFFYLDDIVPVIERIITNRNVVNHINLTYHDHFDLINVAVLIIKHSGIKNLGISLISMKEDKAYTGCDGALQSLKIPLIGLEEGIRRTCEKLL